MASIRDQHGFPPVPQTLNAGEYEMYDRQTVKSAPPSTIPTYTPYLGLQARLSQIWLNKWTILLILIILRLMLATKDINSQIDNAKTEALSACTSVENVGSAMASMPHYMSGGVNALAADGVTKAVNGLMSMLTLTISGLEEIILFWINMLTSTYVCLITFAVGGSLHVALNAIEEVGAFVNKTIGSITGEMATDVAKFQDTLNSFLSGFIGGITGKTPPKIDFLNDEIASLRNIHFDPTAMNADLNRINSSIPNFEQVHNFTNNAIRLPFEEIKKLINESMVAYKFDKSVFPVAQKQALTFCSDNTTINDFFGGLLNTVIKTRTTVIIVLSLLAALVCVPMAYREIQRWRSMRQRSILLQKHAFDPIDVIYIASRPLTGSAGIRISSWFKNNKTQILVRWWVAYITTIPALFVLALGIAGLLSCLCQFIVLKFIEKEVPALAEEVGDFAGIVVKALNNASTAWAVGANQVIASTNTDINNDVFGWVNTSTTAVNATLNIFVNEMTGALNTTFGGTILYEPIMEVLNCLVLLKITGIQKGLTWVHDNAHVSFPQFTPDVFSLGAAASISSNASATESFLSSPGDVASDGITSAIVKLVNKLTEQVRTEAIISSCLVALWFLLVLVGLGRVLVAMFTRDKTRAEGGFTGDNRVPLSPRRSPNRLDEARFPGFGSQAIESSVRPNGGWDEEKDEGKVGVVGRKEVGKIVKGHERSSSYGYVDEKRG